MSAITWYEHKDGSWQARHSQSGAYLTSAPFHLVVRADGGPSSWYWEVSQQGVIVRSGSSSDAGEARMKAHGQMAQYAVRH